MNVTSITNIPAEIFFQESHAANAGTTDTSSDRSDMNAEPKGNISNETIKALAEDIQERLSSINISFDFSTYGKNGEKMSVRVSNKETGEIIREIPPKELQNLYIKLEEVAGLIFNGIA